jgi:hypothetical protein
VDRPLPEHANQGVAGHRVHGFPRSSIHAAEADFFASEGITSTFGSSRFSGKTKRRQEAVVQPSIAGAGKLCPMRDEKNGRY